MFVGIAILCFISSVAGIIVGIAILCFISPVAGIITVVINLTILYLCGRIKDYEASIHPLSSNVFGDIETGSNQDDDNSNSFPTFADDFHNNKISGIDHFPTLVLGESLRLPRLNHDTCARCLVEYEPSDTLRSIPGCSHYFHAQCIDPWLQLKSTCPLCRGS